MAELWEGGTCPTEEFEYRYDIRTDAFQCRQTCGTPGLWGEIRWLHLFPLPSWVPEAGHMACFDKIISLSNITCGAHATGAWSFELQALHEAPLRDPPEYTDARAVYARASTGNQDYPRGRYYKVPLLSSCVYPCVEYDWPAEIVLARWIH